MKMTVMNTSTYRGYEINSDETGTKPVYREILDPMMDQVEGLVSRNCRSTILRFDLRFDDDWQNDRKLENAAVTKLLRSIRAALSSGKWGKHKDIITGWVFEKSKSNGSHYHVFIGFKALYLRLGALSSTGYTGLYLLIRNAWSEASGGSVHFSKCHTVNRSRPDQIEGCIRHLSYLSKVRSKQFGLGVTAKNFSYSKRRLAQETFDDRNSQTVPILGL